MELVMPWRRLLVTTCRIVKKLLLGARGRFGNMATYGNIENRKVPNELEDLNGDFPGKKYEISTCFL